jgi:hypothetical protein
VIKSDKELLWRPAHRFIPVSAFTGLIGTAGVRAGTGTGAPVEQEISTLGINAVLMDTAADELNHLEMLPDDFDTKKNMYVRVHFTTASATAADTITWLVRYLQIVPNVTTLISAATATNTLIAQMTVTGTALSYQVSPWGVINGGVISEKAEMIQWEVEMDEFAVGLTEDKFLLGLEIMYTPKRLQGPDGMLRPAKATAAMLSKV